MKTFLTILGILLICSLNAQEIPQKISYQGKLLENGLPVNGIKNMTFTIGSWSETQSVPVSDGLYSVNLGDNNPIPISLFNNSSSLNLQISVSGTNLTPQTEIIAVPYSFKTEESVNTEKIAGNTVSTTIPINNQVLKWNGALWEPGNDDLSLPYDEIYNGSSYAAFEITTTGTPTHILALENENQNSNTKVMDLTSNGSGVVLDISNDGTNGALNIDNEGTWALDIDNNGSGDAININNSGNGNALYVTQHNDSKYCARFEIDNSNNPKDAIYARTQGTGYAGYFYGDVDINGTLSKSGGTFKIDHPLDPENKYLYHSFVESPDMMNVYNGNIVLDNNGEGIVNLPDWFERLNGDFRYQLTCIGGHAQIYVSKEVENNQFQIAGGYPNLKVSWQVTGIRKDPWAEKHRVQVEVEKNEQEKGHYLHYKEYNQPVEKSIQSIKN